MMLFWAAMVATAVPKAALAESRRTAIAWQRGPEAHTCISQDKLTKAVRARLAPDMIVDSPADAGVVLSGQIEKTDSGWRVTIISAHGGARVFERSDQRCRALDDEIVLIIALAIEPPATEPAASQREKERNEAGNTNAGTRKIAVADQAPAREHVSSNAAFKSSTSASDKSRRSTSRPTHLRVAFDLGVSGAWGVTPTVAPGPVIGGAIDFRRWGIEANAAWFPYAVAEIPTLGSAIIQVFWGGVALCPVLFAREVREDNSLRLSICGALNVGFTHAQAQGFDVNRDGLRWLVTGALSLKLRWRFASRWAFFAKLSGIVPFVRSRFEYRDSSGEILEIFRSASIGGSLTLGASFFLK